MGSWTDLDASYPPGTLTPGAAFVVALGHLAGAASVYAGPPGAALADFLPRYCAGIVPTGDLIERAERYLREVPLDVFLAEAGALLNPQQRRCLALNLLDAALGHEAAPAGRALLPQLIEGLGIPADELAAEWRLLLFKNDLSIFPQ